MKNTFTSSAQPNVVYFSDELVSGGPNESPNRHRKIILKASEGPPIP